MAQCDVYPRSQLRCAPRRNRDDEPTPGKTTLVEKLAPIQSSERQFELRRPARRDRHGGRAWRREGAAGVDKADDQRAAITEAELKVLGLAGEL